MMRSFKIAWRFDRKTLCGLVLCLTVVGLRAINSAETGTGNSATTTGEEHKAGETRVYENRLKEIENPKPLLADYPQYIAPVEELRRFEAPPLVVDTEANLSVRAWRFSYNARGIIEIPNSLRGAETALIVVHPWGIDDGQGWKTPEPNGVCDFCTPSKNQLSGKHVREVVNPFVQRMRPHVALTMYSLTGVEDPIRKKLYRSIHGSPTDQQRIEGAAELKAKLDGFNYRAEPLQASYQISVNKPVVDYFKQFRGLDPGSRYNGAGYWNLPIPLTKDIDADPADVVIYDGDGYPALRDFLVKQGVRHILLAGYATDLCFAGTTAGYRNLSKDFNVFLVGDATLATFPGNKSPAYATNAAISYASIDHPITQISWIKPMAKSQ